MAPGFYEVHSYHLWWTDMPRQVSNFVFEGKRLPQTYIWGVDGFPRIDQHFPVVVPLLEVTDGRLTISVSGPATSYAMR